MTRKYMDKDIVKAYTDKMLNIALEADGTNIFVFGEYAQDLCKTYLEDGSYLMDILKSKDKKYKGVKINKQNRRIRFKNGSAIFFSPIRTEFQADCITGAEIHTAFIHQANKLPLMNIQRIMTRMRFGPWKPPEDKIYSKDNPYMYLDGRPDDLPKYVDKKYFEIYKEGEIIWE